MKQVLNVSPVDSTVMLTSDIVYSHRTEFCGSQYVPMKLSLLRPRYHFACDRGEVLPVLLFLCGGGWTETDHNVWLAELAWYAKRGYCVASIQYPVSAATRFPENVVCVKEAIRFLRANAAELRLDMDHTALMGESAGAYLALICAASAGMYGSGNFAGVPDTTNAVVALYAPISPSELKDPDGSCVIDLPLDAEKYPSVLDTVSSAMVPTMLLHGKDDSLVPCSHSERIYDRLQELGVDSSLVILNGADHADNKFFQPQVKELVLDFLDKSVRG